MYVEDGDGNTVSSFSAFWPVWTYSCRLAAVASHRCDELQGPLSHDPHQAAEVPASGCGPHALCYDLRLAVSCLGLRDRHTLLTCVSVRVRVCVPKVGEIFQRWHALKRNYDLYMDKRQFAAISGAAAWAWVWACGNPHQHRACTLGLPKYWQDVAPRSPSRY
jgi:hypothetical protein